MGGGFHTTLLTFIPVKHAVPLQFPKPPVRSTMSLDVLWTLRSFGGLKKKTTHPHVRYEKIEDLPQKSAKKTHQLRER